MNKTIAGLFLAATIATQATAQSNTTAETLLRGLINEEALLTVHTARQLMEIYVDGTLMGQSDASQTVNIIIPKGKHTVVSRILSEDGLDELTTTTQVFTQQGQNFVLDLRDTALETVRTDAGKKVDLTQLRDEMIAEYQSLFFFEPIYVALANVKSRYKFGIFQECQRSYPDLKGFKKGGALSTQGNIDFLKPFWNKIDASIPTKPRKAFEPTLDAIHADNVKRLNKLSANGETYGITFPTHLLGDNAPFEHYTAFDGLAETRLKTAPPSHQQIWDADWAKNLETACSYIEFNADRIFDFYGRQPEDTKAN